jgi:hypothetical protein
MENKTRVSYIRRLAPLWAKAFGFWIPIPTWGQVVTGIILFVISTIFIFNFTGDIEFLVNTVVGQYVQWSYTIGWAVFILLLSFYRANYVLFHEQENKLDLFWPQTLDISVRYSNFRNIQNENGDEFPAVALTVKNIHPNLKIVELDAVINHLAHSYIENGDPRTLHHSPDQKTYWNAGNENELGVSLRPGQEADLFVAYIARPLKDEDLHTIVGQSYRHYLFQKESMFQVNITLMGKLEGQGEFKRYSSTRVLYAHPEASEIYDLEFFSQLFGYESVPDPLKKIWEGAENGYWIDYSTPFHRQQEQKQKELREASKTKKDLDL